MQVFDLKTGGARLTSKQVQHIQAQTRKNEAVTDFINDIQGRQSVNKDKSLQIQYFSRDAVNWRQNIDSVKSKTNE